MSSELNIGGKNSVLLISGFISLETYECCFQYCARETFELTEKQTAL